MSDGTENIDVAFQSGGVPIGTGRTNDEGYCELQENIEQTGEMPEIVSRARVDGQWLETQKQTFQWEKNRTIIAVDIDGTICRPDYDDLILDRVDRESVPLPGSVETLNTLAESCYIAYVTARPRFTLEKTRRWLHDHHYPDGPVYTAARLRQVAEPGKFKRRFLKRIKQCWPNLLIGIGDKSSDGRAYMQNGMLAIILRGDEDDEENESELAGSNDRLVRLPDWHAIDRYFQENADRLMQPDHLRAEVSAGQVHLND